jgi:hypothetical protein
MRALALLALLAALVAGCGAKETVAVEEITAAAQRTVETGSSRVELTGGDGADSFTVSGVVDYEEGEAQLILSRTSGGETEEGELRIVDETFFVRTPEGLGGLLTDKPWLALTLPDGRRGSLQALGFPFPTVDPDELIRMLEDVAGEVTRLGDEDVRGVSAEGYRVELDLARLGRGEETLPVELWVDDDGRVRRVTLEHDGQEATADFYDFGADADVQAPPPGEVGDLSSLMDVFREGED